MFEGAIPGTSEVVPEARTLLEWARELGVEVGETAAEAVPAAGPSSEPAADRAVTPDDCIIPLAIKGLAPAQGVADAVLSTPDDVTPILDQLVAEGLATTVAGAYRLSESGTTRATDLRAAERDSWGTDGAIAALDAFLDLDHRMKNRRDRVAAPR